MPAESLKADPISASQGENAAPPTTGAIPRDVTGRTGWLDAFYSCHSSPEIRRGEKQR